MNYTLNMGMNMPDENDKFSIDHFNANFQALDIVGKTDEYKTTKTYAVGDLCILNDILYKCIVAVESAEEFDAEKWEVTSLCKEEIANRTAIDELTENLTASDNLQFKFGIDGDGNYGYYGADGSLVPFSSKPVIYNSFTRGYNYRGATFYIPGGGVDDNYYYNSVITEQGISEKDGYLIFDKPGSYNISTIPVWLGSAPSAGKVTIEIVRSDGNTETIDYTCIGSECAGDPYVDTVDINDGDKVRFEVSRTSGSSWHNVYILINNA